MARLLNEDRRNFVGMLHAWQTEAYTLYTTKSASDARKNVIVVYIAHVLCHALGMLDAEVVSSHRTIVNSVTDVYFPSPLSSRAMCCNSTSLSQTQARRQASNASSPLPLTWLPIIPLGGVHNFRDLKKQVYAYVRAIELPFTIVDVGW